LLRWVGGAEVEVLATDQLPNYQRTSDQCAGKEGHMKKAASKRLTQKQMAELESLAALPDGAIDTSDAPELPDWAGAKRGLFYQLQLTLRLDADVVAWFKTRATSEEAYQTRINRALRDYMRERASRRDDRSGRDDVAIQA